jgi:hypothetical protein
MFNEDDSYIQELQYQYYAEGEDYDEDADSHYEMQNEDGWMNLSDE